MRETVPSAPWRVPDQGKGEIPREREPQGGEGAGREVEREEEEVEAAALLWG